MNPTRVIRHLACILAGLAGALLAASAAAPAASGATPGPAQQPDPPEPGRHPGPDIPSVPPLEVGAAGPHTAHAPAPDRHPVGQSRDRRRPGKKEQQ
jgi:hypothetical protein